MSISLLFKTDGTLTRGQINWLKMVARIPKIKMVFGNAVIEEDIVLAEEAKNILREHGEAEE